MVDRQRVAVERSARRSRTAAARVRDGRIVVRVPAGIGVAEEEALVGRLLDRLHARALAPDVPQGPPPTVPARPTRGRTGPRGCVRLVARADEVGRRWLGGVRADRVTWSHRMQTRWASCTPAARAVRVSHRLATAPDEVLDDVLLHELAHLLERGHGPAFRALVERNPAADTVRDWLEQHQRHELRLALGLWPGPAARG